LSEESGYWELRSTLVTDLKRQGIIKSKAVEDAFLSIRREDFAWKEYAGSAYFDEPLPLGDTGQTISAPHMVAIMLEEAELLRGMKVLEVGTGSGYNAALIGHIVDNGIEQASRPLVFTVERNLELVKYAKLNLKKAKLDEVVEVVMGDGSLGYPEKSEVMLYDRILVTAGAPRIPVHLEKQLKLGGILLIPIGVTSYQTLVKVRKVQSRTGEPLLTKTSLMPVMFVPLISKEQVPSKFQE
jgi:protein-L-isoaspartate(D-aspartate) O-methyltransferase